MQPLLLQLQEHLTNLLNSKLQLISLPLLSLLNKIRTITSYLVMENYLIMV
eukprot:NODE_285_length_1962_cov_102.579718_g238_i0.p7 GENE.NODE_285_length_1962_cov_102.579718_g238_i0~~NODE_285_length_1962_cov_102.579718_g238_i0.p7  ORF type:complete len:51 (-),score=4.16 NODE_285_length_1962_cov_102.579718_g238_i0:545-697(-)